MDIGFNLIEQNNDNIFKDKISIIQFLRDLISDKKMPCDFAIYGLDSLLYYAKDRDDISKYIRHILQDHANKLVSGKYIIQIVIKGSLQVVDNDERPRVSYKNEEIHIYPVLGRLKRKDLKHFYAPLNLQS